MASWFGLRNGEGQQESSGRNGCNEPSNRASCWGDLDKYIDKEDSLRERLREKDDHLARLQEMLRSERDKSGRLQLQCRQQEAELRHRELHANRLKERLTQRIDGRGKREAAIEVLNAPDRIGNQREPAARNLAVAANHEDAALRLMLERREAELRENMKLRHSLASLLRALRDDMEQTLSDPAASRQDRDKSLDGAEEALGEHVTGGVVQSWRRAQRKLQHAWSDGGSGGTDQEKLLTRLQADLQESQQLVRVQQQLLQDGLISPAPPELGDCYFLEEWERLQMRRSELERQRRAFEGERRSFTDAAVRLGREVKTPNLEVVRFQMKVEKLKRCEFEQQKASRQKRLFLSDSPGGLRRESFSFSDLWTGSVPGLLVATPSSSVSGISAIEPDSPVARVRVQTPSTPELFSALGLRFD